MNEDRFPCFDGKGADYIPDPIISADAFNRNLRFSTSKPGFVDVDWGDGTKDQYPLVKISDGSYRIVFRSLDIEYKRILTILHGGIGRRMDLSIYRFLHISIAISGVGRLR